MNDATVDYTLYDIKNPIQFFLLSSLSEYQMKICVNNIVIKVKLSLLTNIMT